MERMAVYFYCYYVHDDGKRTWCQVTPSTRDRNWVMVSFQHDDGHWDAHYGRMYYGYMFNKYEFPNHDRHEFNAQCRATWAPLGRAVA